VVEVRHAAWRLGRGPRCDGRDLRQRIARRHFLWGVAKALNVRPSVVAPGHDAVHLVVVRRTVLAQVQLAAVRERQPLRVAVAVTVDPVPKGVVRRRVSVPIHPEHLAPEVVHTGETGEAGAELVIFRVHTAGEPERYLVE